jgi:CRP/FNR family cyclic AMP-dependent transcriptional regulator
VANRARRGAGYTFFSQHRGACRLELKRSLLVPYSAESMFDLIEQAELYPQFLPWCTGATILERSDEWVAARIEFTYLQIRFGFQTRNPKRRPEWLQVRLVEGPFRRFQCNWQLTPLGDQGCRIGFDLSYEIAEGVLDKIAARAVDIVSRSMMDAFVKRAEDILGVGGSTPALAAPLVPQSVPAPSADAMPESVTTQVVAPAHQQTLSVTSCEPTMSATDTALYEAVRACPLARELTPEQTALLAPLLSLETFPAKQVLATEGATDSRLYVVVDGALGVVKHQGTPDETLLATLHAGDFAHELGFLDGAPRYSTLVATSSSRVLVLEREKLESLIDTQPQILYRLMCAIVRTVHRVQTRLSMQASELTNYIVKQHGRY